MGQLDWVHVQGLTACFLIITCAFSSFPFYEGDDRNYKDGAIKPLHLDSNLKGQIKLRYLSNTLVLSVKNNVANPCRWKSSQQKPARVDSSKNVDSNTFLFYDLNHQHKLLIRNIEMSNVVVSTFKITAVLSTETNEVPKNLTETWKQFSENLNTEILALNSDARIGGEDFSVYEVVPVQLSNIETSDTNSSASLALNVVHNLSDEDFSFDETPVTLTQKQATSLIQERLGFALERSRKESGLSLNLGDVSVESVEVEIT